MPVPPTYEDATLVLKLYELRREARLREAREWFVQKFFPQSIEDVRAVGQGGGVENESYRMVTSYWEMAASFVAHGVLHPELFFESGGESLIVWAKLDTYLPQMRQEQQAPRLLANLEKAISMFPPAGERLAGFRTRMAAMRERMLKAQKA
jgi:hypothetical protein